MATKSAIGKMAQEAQDRLAEAMQRLSDSLGIVPINVTAIRYRDPAYEAAARLAALADWAGEIADLVEDTLFDGVNSDKLAVVRVVLQDVLGAKTKAELEQFATSYGLDADAKAKKDEIVASLAEQLTGKRLEIVDGVDAPGGDELSDPLIVLDHPPLPDMADDQVVRISDVED